MRVLVLLLGMLLALPTEARANSSSSAFLTADEALELAFPECTIERATVYLTKEQKRRAEGLAGFEIENGIVYVYTARKDGEVVGCAYFDTHKVRTKGETIMIAVDARNRVSRIELLAFAEPREYIPAGAWYAQFLGHELNSKLRLKGDVRGVAGATLTAHATTSAVRRTLALHAVVHDRDRIVTAGSSGTP